MKDLQEKDESITGVAQSQHSTPFFILINNKHEDENF